MASVRASDSPSASSARLASAKIDIMECLAAKTYFGLYSYIRQYAARIHVVEYHDFQSTAFCGPLCMMPTEHT